MRYMQKRDFDPIMFSRKGTGRIDDSIPIDLLEYVTPKSAEALDNSALCCIPAQLTVSEESPAIRLSILTVGQSIALTTFLKMCSTPVAL